MFGHHYGHRFGIEHLGRQSVLFHVEQARHMSMGFAEVAGVADLVRVVCADRPLLGCRVCVPTRGARCSVLLAVSVLVRLPALLVDLRWRALELLLAE